MLLSHCAHHWVLALVFSFCNLDAVDLTAPFDWKKCPSSCSSPKSSSPVDGAGLELPDPCKPMRQEEGSLRQGRVA